MTTQRAAEPPAIHPTRTHTGSPGPHMPDPARTLIGISLFNAVSAIGGGIGLVTGALPVPTSLLDPTPFDSYVVPGLVLAVVIGGSSLVGAFALLSHTRRGRCISAATGLIMVGWIIGETLIVQGFSWLQGLYLATGLLVTVGSWHLPATAPEGLGARGLTAGLPAGTRWTG